MCIGLLCVRHVDNERVVCGVFLVFRLLCPPIQLEWAVEKLIDCPAVEVDFRHPCHLPYPIVSYRILSYPIHKRDILLAAWIRIIHLRCGLSCCAILSLYGVVVFTVSSVACAHAPLLLRAWCCFFLLVGWVIDSWFIVYLQACWVGGSGCLHSLSLSFCGRE